MTITPKTDGLGNDVEAVKSLNDDLTRKIKSLTEENLRYRSLFDQTIDAIFFMDAYRFVECNQKTLSMFGCDGFHEILGRYPWDFSPSRQPDGRPSKEKAMALIDAALDGNPQKFVWRSCRKSGEEFDSEVSLNLIETRETKLVQAIVRETALSETPLKPSRNPVKERPPS